jgi:hypothetical protein
MLQEEGGQGRFEQCGEHVAIPRQPLELFRRDDARALLDQPLTELEIARDDGAAGPGDDVGADLRQPALGEIGIPLVERPCDGELEDAVPEELEPLVGLRSIRRPRRVGEGVVEPLGGQPPDQARKSCGFPRLRATTGAR